MKSKLRTIVIDKVTFKYVIKEKFHTDEGTKLGYWITTLRVFRLDRKNTPLEVMFTNNDGYTVGNLLTSSSNSDDNAVNLHKPSIIRKIIEEGIKQNWNWEQAKLVIKDGLELLERIGFEVTNLKLEEDINAE